VIKKESASLREIERLKPRIEKLSRDDRLPKWIEYAKEVRTNSINKLFVVTEPKGRMTVRIGNIVYHGTLENPPRWEESLAVEEVNKLENMIAPSRKALQKLSLSGFARSDRGDIVRLYVEPKVILVVLSETASQQAKEMYDRYVKEGKDFRGDFILKLGEGLYVQSERR
jgi:hypothetical protein